MGQPNSLVLQNRMNNQNQNQSDDELLIPPHIAQQYISIFSSYAESCDVLNQCNEENCIIDLDPNNRTTSSSTTS